MSEDQSARLALPFIQPGQAQKEMAHNEAIALLDAIVQASVVSVGDDVPPALPGEGQCWITGAMPGGDWAGHASALACWTTGGWRFVTPFEGMIVWSEADLMPVRHTGGVWIIGAITGRTLIIGGDAVVGMQQSAIADPSGGTIIDGEARMTISAVLNTLRAHGLIAV